MNKLFFACDLEEQRLPFLLFCFFCCMLQPHGYYCILFTSHSISPLVSNIPLSIENFDGMAPIIAHWLKKLGYGSPKWNTRPSHY
ncbi:hypothetical protein VIGAN_01058500 [Vigna angularis var. angularis]|uniref:Uncharacterized protein n=1 Tax=Vigna angularis var. angularis TaxID=157739 RepID=A0A0S3QXT7_PHAAN|nr:hypothetical protein VIGAN_01058500 [Vigna angularis var. angularis]